MHVCIVLALTAHCFVYTSCEVNNHINHIIRLWACFVFPAQLNLFSLSIIEDSLLKHLIWY